MESTRSSRGQITIPKAIRDHLRVSPGDRVKFFIHPDWYGGDPAKDSGQRVARNPRFQDPQARDQ